MRSLSSLLRRPATPRRQMTSVQSFPGSIVLCRPPGRVRLPLTKENSMEGINLWAVLVAAASSFLLGGIWYGPLFLKLWCREAGVDPDPAKGRHPAKVFGGAFVLAVIAAYVFALFLGPQPELKFALGAGFAAGLGWVATSFGINYPLANRSLLLWLIDGGYHTLQFTVFGLVLGLWH